MNYAVSKWKLLLPHVQVGKVENFLSVLIAY